MKRIYSLLSRANPRGHRLLLCISFLFQVKHTVDDCSESINVGFLHVQLNLLTFPANKGKSRVRALVLRFCPVMTLVHS